MALAIPFIVLVFCCVSVPAWEEKADIVGPTWNDYVAKLDAIKNDPRVRQDEQRYQRMVQESNLNASEPRTFPCHLADLYTDVKFKRSSSVHTLTARDIEVVAAIGDSITAGNGIDARTAVGVTTQYRGFSWSVGGEVGYDDNSHTVPNVLKNYNADVTGYSLGTGPADEYIKARMNVAVPGSIARDLPEQAIRLVQLLKERDLDKTPWKMVTLFIGGNDLCRYCNNPEVLSAENYAKHIQDTLDYLHDNLERVFVNLVGIFDLTVLGKIEIGFTCKVLHPVLCPCGIDPQEEEVIRQAAYDYQKHTIALVDSGRYDGRNDFTVVWQPFFMNMDVPRKPNGKADLTYMAPDCFHFSRKGHNSVATFLWNAMFQPVGSKSHFMPYDIETHCPKVTDYIATKQNSAPDFRIPRVEDDAEEEAEPEGDFYDLIPRTWRVPVFWCLTVVTTLLLLGLTATLLFVIITRTRRQADGKMHEKDVQPLLI